jgi:hypothetical protein
MYLTIKIHCINPQLFGKPWGSNIIKYVSATQGKSSKQIGAPILNV